MSNNPFYVTARMTIPRWALPELRQCIKLWRAWMRFRYGEFWEIMPIRPEVRQYDGSENDGKS